MPKIKIILIFLFSFQLGFSAYADLEKKGKEFLYYLKDGKYDEAQGMLAEIMVSALEKKGLKIQTLWDGLISQMGNYKEIKKIKIKEEMGYQCVYISTIFDKDLIDIKIVFDKDKKVAGLFFLPSKDEEEYKLPDYSKQKLYKEIDLTFGKENFKLGGTLTLPELEGPFPLVILVHGSGPQDRDETIGPNKPFKDLATGLASNKIAVFRYEKRTKAYPEECNSMIDKFTVNEETIEDAQEAIKFLKGKKEYKFSKIFILGHSLGATLAPRIALNSKDLNGLILLAGVPYGFYINKVLMETEYIFSLDGKIDEEEKEKLKDLEEQLNKIKNLKIEKGEVILGASRTYWADLQKYNPVETIKKLKIPIFIIQGGRDYQVTREDFQFWKENLKDLKNAEFKLYPDLNHLFIYGKEKSTPAEYQIFGNVSEEVVKDISNWINKMMP